ncbi:hypothetical protein ACCAA_340017 [Candidatus Accumulibacter aalborgensis]|uniref:Uncharacterized protein n=1 Tax=Candidatus Accumulibacter aalborgensis TaxID=1860102 RepID=A0A1A8XPC5_9PROT|nr:hypothetical protein ACCAA_340017 [Candidatus Accumulibacter aalborgensis]
MDDTPDDTPAGIKIHRTRYNSTPLLLDHPSHGLLRDTVSGMTDTDQDRHLPTASLTESA